VCQTKSSSIPVCGTKSLTVPVCGTKSLGMCLTKPLGVVQLGGLLLAPATEGKASRGRPHGELVAEVLVDALQARHLPTEEIAGFLRDASTSGAASFSSYSIGKPVEFIACR
jgi:hypothetical protein